MVGDQTSAELLNRARQGLESDGVLRASHLLWSAAIHEVRSLAERRGWPHDSHRRLFEAVDRLADETGDPNMKILFAYAGALRSNAYEDWAPRGFVEVGPAAIEEFIAKIRSA